MLLHAKGELAAARPLFECALAFREKVLGTEHPNTRHARKKLTAFMWRSRVALAVKAAVGAIGWAITTVIRR
jgi:hypothetical protein